MEMEDPGFDQGTTDPDCDSGAACSFSELGGKSTGLSGPDIACTAPIGRLWRLSRCKVGLGVKILIKDDTSGVVRTEFYCFKKIQVYKF
jgi:hypothetical protein